jgi:hypothetical protein
MKRAFLACSIVFCLSWYSAGVVRADQLYNLVPFTYTDNLNSAYTDTLSGTIDVVGPSIYGTWSQSNSTNAPTFDCNFTMTSTGPIAPISASASVSLATEISNNWIQNAGVTVSPTGISLPNGSTGAGGSFFLLQVIGAATQVNTTWYTASNGNELFSWSSPVPNISGAVMEMEDINASGFYGVSPNAWVIATAQAVPEPTAIISLVGMGLMGLFGLCKWGRNGGLAA